jgi:endonuclease/exonuclease/phosphatase family metal-dependent hydrolase
MPRILTYNVHRCVGVDRKLDVARVADVIAAQEPDIVALQELDVGRLRTGNVDQAHEIAQRLEMTFHFNAAMKLVRP